MKQGIMFLSEVVNELKNEKEKSLLFGFEFVLDPAFSRGGP